MWTNFVNLFEHQSLFSLFHHSPSHIIHTNVTKGKINNYCFFDSNKTAVDRYVYVIKMLYDY